MAKSQVSAGFAKFATKTTKGKFDEARQGERMGRGVPFPVGTTGIGIVTAIICDEGTDKDGVKFPRGRIEIKVETPESGRGKTLSGAGLMQQIKDGPNPEKWSAEMAWGAWLGLLEDLGCPEEITKQYESFEDEVIAWFEAEPRRVHWEVQENNYINKAGSEVKGKQVRAYAFVDEKDIPSAEDKKPKDDGEGVYCTYRGARHKIVMDYGDTVDLLSLSNGRARAGIDKDDIEME